MRIFISVLLLLTGLSSTAQFNIQSYQDATLKLRNGEVLEGEAKITYDELVKFRKGKKKETYNYRNLESFTIGDDRERLSYIYKIIAGKEPRLMRIIKEYDGVINLYAIEYHHSSPPGNMPSSPSGVGVTTSVSLDVSEYYASKNNGHEVVKLGNNHPVFGKGRFKKNVAEFFEDCPDLIEQVENNELKRMDMIELIEFYKNECG